MNIKYKPALLYTVVAISFILIFATPSMNKMASFAYPMGNAKEMIGKGHNFGQIVGMVQNKDGTTEWLLSGHFNTNIVNNTQFTDTNKALFDAKIHMVKPDGLEKHKHEISNFVLKESTKENNMPVYKGTVTITMKNASVNDVPITLKVDNRDVINIMLDQTKLDNHFGDKPIYGIVFEPMKYQEKPMTSAGTTLGNKSSEYK